MPNVVVQHHTPGDVLQEGVSGFASGYGTGQGFRLRNEEDKRQQEALALEKERTHAYLTGLSHARQLQDAEEARAQAQEARAAATGRIALQEHQLNLTQGQQAQAEHEDLIHGGIIDWRRRAAALLKSYPEAKPELDAVFNGAFGPGGGKTEAGRLMLVDKGTEEVAARYAARDQLLNMATRFDDVEKGQQAGALTGKLKQKAEEYRQYAQSNLPGPQMAAIAKDGEGLLKTLEAEHTRLLVNTQGRQDVSSKLMERIQRMGGTDNPNYWKMMNVVARATSGTDTLTEPEIKDIFDSFSIASGESVQYVNRLGKSMAVSPEIAAELKDQADALHEAKMQALQLQQMQAQAAITRAGQTPPSLVDTNEDQEKRAIALADKMAQSLTEVGKQTPYEELLKRARVMVREGVQGGPQVPLRSPEDDLLEQAIREKWSDDRYIQEASKRGILK